MRRLFAGIGLAACLTLTLPGAAWAQETGDTADTGADTGSGSDDGTTGDDGTVSDTGGGEDTEAYVAGSNAADLAGDKGGCQSLFGSSAAFLFLLGTGAALRRRR